MLVVIYLLFGYFYRYTDKPAYNDHPKDPPK